MKKLVILLIAIGALLLPSAAQANTCSNDWQFVGYAIVAYSHAPTVEGKEQLLHELVAGLRRTERDCGE